MADSQLLEDTSVVTEVTEPGDHDLFSHYAKKTDIERAIFDGVEIEALCGKKWRPSRDFTKFPVCQTCQDLYDQLSND